MKLVIVVLVCCTVLCVAVETHCALVDQSLRATAKESSSRVGRIRSGERITVLEEGKRWVRVRTASGVVGWAFLPFVGPCAVETSSNSNVRRPGTARCPDPSEDEDDWLAKINYYRCQAGLEPVRHDKKLDEATEAHACYMALHNGASHREQPRQIGYSVAGAIAGAHSDVDFQPTRLETPPTRVIDSFMSSPFRAIGLLRPTLQNVTYQHCSIDNSTAVAINVIDGLAYPVQAKRVIHWPANGEITRLRQGSGFEIPSAGRMCGYGEYFGQPLYVFYPEPITAAPRVTLTDVARNKTIETCSLWAEHAPADPRHRSLRRVARSTLRDMFALFILPQQIFTNGLFTVSVDTLTWNFTVA